MLIHSPAFPTGQPQPAHSNVHRLLKEATSVSTSISYRELRDGDLKNLRDLNKEWFPVNYGDLFYERIKEKKSRGWVAECCISTKKYTDLHVIVGAVVYEYTPAQSIFQKDSWREVLYNDSQALYVMTLGVIDEFRGKGIASTLLDKILQEASEDARVKYVNLHVVSYNPARYFYEKRGFERVEELPEYYRINGTLYDAIYYVMFVNGAKRRLGWLEWLRSFLW